MKKNYEALSQPVRRRRVFYVPGYDPFPPRRYREMYRRESVKQAEISGYKIEMRRKREGASRFGWAVSAEIDGKSTETDVDVLYWADLVREHMDQRILPSYLKMLNLLWGYISTGAVPRMMRLRPAVIFLAYFYPIAMLLGHLLLALLAAALIAVPLWVFVSPFLVPIGLIMVPPVLRYFKRIDGRFYAYYLLHDYSYPLETMGAYSPELEARITAFVHQLREALSEDVDEVLVVGHSSGAHLAVSIISDLLREGRLPEKRPPLALLSLGHVVPMSSFLPNAWRLRGDLNYLCQREEIVWIDITAPADGGCFALCDPVSVSGVAPKEGKIWPMVVSAAYSKALKPETWKELKWQFYKCHLQYLCAFDKPRRYDYFRITAGPEALAYRIRDWIPSRSRKEKAVSGYRSTAP